MSFVLWQTDAGLSLGSTRQVLRAHEVPLLHDATRAAQALAERCREQTAQLEAERQAARQQGQAEGFEAGLQQAQTQLADTLAAWAAQARQDNEQQRATLAALALQVARKIIGELPAPERLTALALQAAQELLPARTLRLHVHPDQLAGVRTRLAALAETGIELAQVRVLADLGLPADACRLETNLGSADASVDAQLQRLAVALGVGSTA